MNNKYIVKSKNMDYELDAVKPNSKLKITWKEVGNKEMRNKINRMHTVNGLLSGNHIYFLQH